MKLKNLVILYSTRTEEEKFSFIRTIRNLRTLAQIIPEKVPKIKVSKEKKDKTRLTIPKLTKEMKLKLKDLGLLE